MRRAKYPRQFTLSLADEEYAQIKEISDSRDLSMAEVSREIFSEYLKSYKPKKSDEFIDFSALKISNKDLPL